MYYSVAFEFLLWFLVMLPKRRRIAIYCPNCAAPVDDGAKKCESCGNTFVILTQTQVQYVPVVPIVQQTYTAPQPPVIYRRPKPFNAAKITLGIIGIVLFFLVFVNSCTVGVSSGIANNGDVSAGGGIILSLFMLVAGIIGVSLRDSRPGAFVSGALFLVGSGAGFITDAKNYSTLPFWSFVSFCFGVCFIIFGALHYHVIHNK